MQRWKQRVAAMGDLEMVGSRFMQAGQRYADSVPTEAIDVAA